MDAGDGTGSFRPRWFLSFASLFLAPSCAFGGRGPIVVLSRIEVEVGTFQKRIVRWIGGVTARLMRRACSRCELVSAQRAAGGEFGGLSRGERV